MPAEPVREHFRRSAISFDALYEEGGFLQRRVRPGLIRRRELAVEVVRAHGSPRVLDVGCGSGRVGEFVLDAGAAEYVGVDFSEPMLELAGERLGRYGDGVRLLQGDFLEIDLEGPFEVVLALGFFDYIRDPEPFVRRMGDVCTSTLVASFPGWNWLKGPVRKVRYEVVHRVPIFDYTPPQIRRLMTDAGFSRVEIDSPGSGFLVRADR